jgi:hypothetical protein
MTYNLTWMFIIIGLIPVLVIHLFDQATVCKA